MRLVCPNCDAEYEVDDTLVPAEGRDVQCSNCTTTWFQAGADSLSADPDVSPTTEEDTDPETEIEAAPAGLTPRRPAVDPAAMDVIHEEVARETAARKAEAGGLETQADLGLDNTDTEARATAARDRVARQRGIEPQPDAIEDTDDALTSAPKRDHTKSELFPDIEEINSSLSPEAAEAEAEAARLAHEEGSPEVKIQRSNFRLGFGLMLLVAVGLLLLYIYEPQISERVPAMSGLLESYVTKIDAFRVWLDLSTQGLVDKIGVTLSDQPEG